MDGEFSTKGLALLNFIKEIISLLRKQIRKMNVR